MTTYDGLRGFRTETHDDSPDDGAVVNATSANGNGSDNGNSGRGRRRRHDNDRNNNEVRRSGVAAATATSGDRGSNGPRVTGNAVSGAPREHNADTAAVCADRLKENAVVTATAVARVDARKRRRRNERWSDDGGAISKNGGGGGGTISKNGGGGGDGGDGGRADRYCRRFFDGLMTRYRELSDERKETYRRTMVRQMDELHDQQDAESQRRRRNVDVAYSGLPHSERSNDSVAVRQPCGRDDRGV